MISVQCIKVSRASRRVQVPITSLSVTTCYNLNVYPLGHMMDGGPGRLAGGDSQAERMRSLSATL